MYSVLYKNDLIHSSQPQPYEVGAITVPILQIGSGDKERSSNFPKVKAISNLDLEVVFITTTPHYFFMNIHIPYNAIIICWSLISYFKLDGGTVCYLFSHW